MLIRNNDNYTEEEEGHGNEYRNTECELGYVEFIRNGRWVMEKNVSNYIRSLVERDRLVTCTLPKRSSYSVRKKRRVCPSTSSYSIPPSLPQLTPCASHDARFAHALHFPRKFPLETEISSELQLTDLRLLASGAKVPVYENIHFSDFLVPNDDNSTLESFTKQSSEKI